MALLEGVSSGISTIPSASVGVIVIGDAALEVNELDLEWSNVYDGDSYMCTKLRVVGLAIIDTDEDSDNLRMFLQTALSGSHFSNTVFYHNNSPLTDIYHSLHTIASGGMFWSGGPYHMTYKEPHDTLMARHNADVLMRMREPARDYRDLEANAVITPEMLGRALPNVVYIPGSNFAVFYKHRLNFGDVNIRSVSSSNFLNSLFTKNLGLSIPYQAMFRPLELELISFDSNVGNRMAALRLVVNVYFNISTILPGPYNDEDNYISKMLPAYHKWSISSSWRVGSKPQIIVKGRLARRCIGHGAPSVYEFLPRSISGLHLIQLDVSTDEDSGESMYMAVFELDYCEPRFYGLAPYMTSDMADSIRAVAHFHVREEAESISDGSTAITTTYEAVLQKQMSDARFGRSFIDDIQRGIDKGFDAIRKLLEGKGIKHIIGDTGQIFTQAGATVTGMAFGDWERVVTQRSIDSHALEDMANSVVRTAVITVVGIPGSLIDQLQVAAYTIAKQIYIGWLTMGIPPAMRLGFRIESGLLQRDFGEFGGGKEGARVLLNPRQRIRPADFISIFGTDKNPVGDFLKDITIGRDALSVITPIRPAKGEAGNLDLSTFLYDNYAVWYYFLRFFASSVVNGFHYTYPRGIIYATKNVNPTILGGFEEIQRLYGNLFNQIYFAHRFFDLETLDDAMSMLLAYMNIGTIKTHVSVDHTVPAVILTMSVAFKNTDYSGMVFLNSIWRVFSKTYDLGNYIGGFIPNEDGRTWPPADHFHGLSRHGNLLPSISFFIPAILPIGSTYAFEFHRRRVPWIWCVGEVDNPAGGRIILPQIGPQAALVNSKFMGIYDHTIYDYGLGNPQHINHVFRTQATHNVREGVKLAYISHGGSIGTGYVRPSITVCYGRRGYPRNYMPGLGAGIIHSMVREFVRNKIPRSHPVTTAIGVAQHFDTMPIETELRSPSPDRSLSEPELDYF